MPSTPTLARLRWAALLLAGTVASSSETSAAPPSEHVYLDAETGRFAAPLRQDASKTIPLYVRAAPDARLELAYWVLQRGETCPEGSSKALTDDQIGRATFRAFAPAGEADDDTEYYTTELGPLLYGVDYCFHVSGLVPHSIAPSEQAQIGRALREAIEGSRGRQLRGDVPGMCRSLGTRDRQICDLREAFAKGLPRRLARLKVTAGGRTEPMALPEAFEHVLREDRTMLDAVADAMAVTAAEQEAAAALAELRAEILEPAGPMVFDPLEGLGRAQLVAFASAEPAKEAVNQAGDDPDDLLEALYSDVVHADFVASRPWEGATGTKEQRQRLRDAFHYADGGRRPRQDPPPRVVVDRDYRNEVARALEVLEPTKDLQPFVDELGQLPRAAGYRSAGDRERLDEFRKLVDGARIAATIVVQQRQAFLTNFAPREGKPSPFVESLLERIRAVRSLGTQAKTAYQPNYVQRFPLYASGDAGVAVGVIPVRGERPRPDVAAYFGLNLYFIPVDKDEPINEVQRPGRNFRRRVSAVAGISFIHPEINETALGTDGVLLRQVVLTGVGIRATDYLRLGGGAMYYTQQSPNPLSDRKYLKVAPYVSVSIDVDVIGTIRDWRDRARGGSSNPTR